MESTKRKLKNLVKAYKKAEPVEYQACIDGVKMQRSMQFNEFAAVQGDHVFERALFEIPETLHGLMINRLNAEELAAFHDKSTGLARWFAREFHEFSLPERGNV